VLELPAEQAAARRSNRSAAEMYERDALQRRLVDGYRRLAELLPDETIVPIDGAQPADAVHTAIVRDLGRRLGLAENTRRGEPGCGER
jgi:thymidylate kinase